MKAVILGKAGSVRIQHKNYRPFYGEESLTDILVQKLVKVMDPRDIYLSCEDGRFRQAAQKWDINFLLRDEKYTTVHVKNVDVVRNVCGSIPGNEDILWCSSTEPFFNEYQEIIDCWNHIDKNIFDSLNVIYPQKRYFLDQNHNPIGFGFGHWHKYSQHIAPLYQLSWAVAILSRKCIDQVSYMIGENPYWYDSYCPVVDIDTEEDWEIAQVMYAHFSGKRHT